VAAAPSCNRYAVRANELAGTHLFVGPADPPALPTFQTLPRGARRAIAHLTDADPVLGEVIRRVGPFRLSPRTEGTHFDAVCRSIIYQQLSGKAAATIHGRVLTLYGGRSPLPRELAATTDEQLRGVGLSRQKLSYLKDLALRVASNELPIETLHDLVDEEVIDALVRIKGVGRWTAQMFLMFRLGRPDVLPDLDLGIQKAIQRAYRLRKRPLPGRVLKIGAAWAPYRTVASWYLWRSLELAE
jgi:DNA-3-methyladenine glycosylase II